MYWDNAFAQKSISTVFPHAWKKTASPRQKKPVSSLNITLYHAKEHPALGMLRHQTWKDGYATFRMLAPEQPRMLSTGPWPWKAMWNHKAGSMPLSENPTKSKVIATRRFSAGFSLSHGFYRKLAKCHMETTEKSRRFTFSQCVCYTKLLLFHNINPRYTLRWKRCSTTCRSLAMERAATLHSRHSLKVVNHIPHKPVYTYRMSCIIHYINLVPYIICHISYVNTS